MTPSGDQTAGPPAAPAVLAGRYERRQLLGVGGMGQVYQGYDRALDRPVALKLLRPQFAADPVFVARFLREATAAARLSHANVVAVYDAGSDGQTHQTHFIVMELVRGRTLRQELDEHGPLPTQRAVAIVSAVAAALQAAHAQGLIHRDVKPGNVMLSDDGQVGQDGQVKVVDFGIARVADAAPITQTAALLGTPQYLAPEQAQGGPPDARWDVYALGVCLYELLTGSPPFAGGTRWPLPTGTSMRGRVRPASCGPTCRPGWSRWCSRQWPRTRGPDIRRRRRCGPTWCGPPPPIRRRSRR